MSPVKTALNVGERLPQLEADLARARRICASYGWTEMELDSLVAGADFRDVLCGASTSGTLLRGESR